MRGKARAWAREEVAVTREVARVSEIVLRLRESRKIVRHERMTYIPVMAITMTNYLLGSRRRSLVRST